VALPVRFGLYLTQARKSWPRILDDFLLAEELGFDTAWLHDHLIDPEGEGVRSFHEAWTLLSAIAARTSRIRLGILVTSNTFRHPALLAKEAVVVDHVSDGRLTLGLGAGWNEEEHRRYGLPFPASAERVDRLEEAVQVLRLLMSQPRTTFSGRYYELNDAPLEPAPIQRPGIPILIAAHRPRMLGIAARYADQWDTFASQPGTSTDGVGDDIAQRVYRFNAACIDVGRDPSLVRRSTSPLANVFESASAFEGFARRHRSLGFTDFLLDPPAPEDLGRMRTIAARTVPALRAEFDAGP
jgi:alkanesulfonate monooxygenase SsuD/methylene tetrahydromethanopterin reductase-like flavin-dependent oxidoreductase (luciferase family)